MSLIAHESNSYEKVVPKVDRKEKLDEQNLTVALRVRPMNEDEIIAGATPVAHQVDDNMVVLMDPSDDPDDILRANRSREKQYVFDVTFDGSCTQKEVYEKTTRSLISSVVNGYNATVFAYGATGAGKTYTMLGTNEDRGIMARTLSDLYQEMDNTREEMAYRVTVSFLEIYNEMIRDLLNPSSGFLELREDARGVVVAGLSAVKAKSSKEVMGLLLKGNKQRTQEPTAANKTSSRSHAVLQITVRQKNRVRDNTSGEVRLGKLFLIDLAGSERAANTQNRGKRMVEGAHINRSLLALGNCINALSDIKNGHKYINYRDSKLTRLLKDALGGNCKTVMIATISPASVHFEESRNTLVYADRAKNIKTKVRRNVMDVSYHIAQYSNIIAELRDEIKRLQHKLDDKAQRTSAIHAVQAELTETQSKDVQKLKVELNKVFNNQMKLRRSLMELDGRMMEIGLEEMRHTDRVQRWEREKAVTTRRHDNEDSNKYTDEDKARELSGSDLDLPDDVLAAQDELRALTLEEENTLRRKEQVLKQLEESKAKAARIEEKVPMLPSSSSQQEILRLLCKIHELELENVTMQSSCVARDMTLRHQELALSQASERGRLADELIMSQRAVIVANDVSVPKDLEELYELYEINKRHTLPDIQAYKNMPLVSLGRKFPETESTSEMDSTASPMALPKIFVPPSGANSQSGANSVARKQLLQKSSQHLNKLEEKDPLFAKSPRAVTLAQNSRISKGSKSTPTLSPTPPTFGGHSARQKSILTLSSRSDADTPEVAMETKEKLNTTRESMDRKLITNKTRNIAALAAAKRRRATERDDGSSFFITESKASDGYLTQSRLAQHDRAFHTPVTHDDAPDTFSQPGTEPTLRRQRPLYRASDAKNGHYDNKNSPYAQQHPRTRKLKDGKPNYQQMTPEEFFKQVFVNNQPQTCLSSNVVRGPAQKPSDSQPGPGSVQSDPKIRSRVPIARHGKQAGKRRSKDNSNTTVHGGSTNRTNQTSETQATSKPRKPLPSIPVYRTGDISVTEL